MSLEVFEFLNNNKLYFIDESNENNRTYDSNTYLRHKTRYKYYSDVRSILILTQDIIEQTTPYKDLKKDKSLVIKLICDFSYIIFPDQI